MSIQIGPFRLDRRIAAGGFGEIWRGAHIASKTDVAVKVITQAHALDANYYEQFRAEVQAFARLDHPGVVRVFDFGTIPKFAEEKSYGKLVAGSPYLVMEFAREGSLDRRMRCMSWETASRVLVRTLRALAHAHARGLVHLDLKPGNILLFEQTSNGLDLRLTDFGLARTVTRLLPGAVNPEHAVLPIDDPDTILGTPAYMAPEQIEGRLLDFGAWTDLYALGVMGWEFVCGKLPFEKDDPVALAVEHLRSPLPLFEPQIRVPEEFEAWLQRLLEKRPDDRFRSAADALHALGWMCGVDTEVDAPIALDLHQRERLDLATGETKLLGVASRRLSIAGAAVASEAVSEAPTEAREPARSTSGAWSFSTDLPPFPPDWRGTAERTHGTKLVGAGLGLYGLRAIPMVDRNAERDALWGALRAVRVSGGARAVLLHGPSGFGKSRLAEWICTTAVECGAASSVFAGHDPAGAPRHGLQALVTRRFGLETAEFDTALKRIDTVLRATGVVDTYETRALAEIVATGGASPGVEGFGADESNRIRFANNAERYAVAARDLARSCRTRPQIVWFDDVQWGADSIAFVRFLLGAAHTRETPVLFVLTAQTEALSERPAEREQLAALESLDAFDSLAVDALPPKDFATLVEELLFLTGNLARHLRERAAGNPLYAVQLVGDWVARGLLEPTPRGFRLQRDSTIELPSDLLEVWQSRMQRAWVDQEPADIQAVLLGGVLGNRVERDEYIDVLARAGLPVPTKLLDSLAAHGLVRQAAEGWSFGHTMFRETVVSALPEERRRELHAICAEMLAARGSETDASIADRRARHLLAAGQPESALKPLLTAAESHVLLGEYTEAHGLLDLWRSAISSLTVDEEDPRQVEGLLVRAETYRRCWELESCEAAATKALDVANRHNLYRSRAEALFILGHVARLGRDFVTAERRIFEALGIFEVLDEFRGKARALRAAAVIARERSQFSQAIDLYEKALNLFWSLNEEGEVADCVCGLGHVYRTQQKYDKARSHYSEARQIALRIGNPHQAAEYTNGLGEIARYRGELDEAERLYRAAHHTMNRIGSKDAIVPQLNLSLTLLLRRDFKAAHDQLAAALPTIDNLAFRAWTLVHLLPCLAHLSRFSEFDRTLVSATESLAESALHDVDIAEAAELCGDLLKIRGEWSRARETLALAATQWHELGNDERRDNALDRIARLEEQT